METSKIKTIEMVRLIRDHQYELTKNMSDEEKLEFYRQRAKALMGQLEKRVEEQQQKTIAA